MPQMTAVHVTRPEGRSFKVVKRSIPEPAADQVRIKVQACGVPVSFRAVLTMNGALYSP